MSNILIPKFTTEDIDERAEAPANLQLGELALSGVNNGLGGENLTLWVGMGEGEQPIEVAGGAREFWVNGAMEAKFNQELSKKANDYSIEIYNGIPGNPMPIKFATVDYSTCDSENGVAIKIGMVSGHGNGINYAFLQDVIIKVNNVGTVVVDNFKYYGYETPTYDGAVRQYGDIFWVIDTANKIIDFYCLMGQFARLKQIPWKRLTYSSGGTITQYTSATVYSSGAKVWANNNQIATMNTVADYIETALVNGRW